MPQILEIALLLAIVTSLLTEVVIVLVLLRVMRFLKQRESEAQAYCVWSANTAPPDESAKANPNCLVPKTEPDYDALYRELVASEKAFRCEHCGKKVTGVPVRQIIDDDGNFLVYVCDSCGEETANPAVD